MSATTSIKSYGSLRRVMAAMLILSLLLPFTLNAKPVYAELRSHDADTHNATNATVQQTVPKQLSATVASQAATPTTYTITDLGEDVYPAKINSAGQVVGRRGPNYYEQSPILWREGVVTELIAGIGNAAGVNGHGQVVGRLGGEGGLAFLWQNGAWNDLGNPPGGFFSNATSINDSGHVVGATDYQGGQRATLWRDGSVLDLGNLSGYNHSSAFDINASGQVVGCGFIYETYQQSAFVWKDGTMTDLGTGSSGGRGSCAVAINDAGQVAGYVSSGGLEAAVWQNGTWTVIGRLGGIEASAQDINNAGQVVGWSDISDGPPPPAPFFTRAFLYSQGTLINLDDRIPADLGWDLQFASGINDLGQIVGYGTFAGKLHGFLLTPSSLPTPIPTYKYVPASRGSFSSPNTAFSRDPVNVVFGTFVSQLTDLSLPGRGLSIAFARSYNSAVAGDDGPLGFGWTHSYNMRLVVESANSVVAIHGDGSGSI